MRSSQLLALAASLSTSAAVYQGFNYGSTKSDGVTFRYQSDFESLFSTAKNLVGTSGFTSARLYTMIQGGSSTNEPTQAIPAAIAQGTTLLLGLWASGGEGVIEAEITALKSAISEWGSSFTSIVAGISVGSEDLYRISPTGVEADSGYGAEPADIVSYISLVRAAIAGTGLSSVPVGHVDTWTAWVNGSNQAVIDACDFIGMDAYPYFQNTMSNGIGNGPSLFNAAFDATKAAVSGKPVWITETGWPVSGPTENLAVASTANAQTYWEQVGCPNFGVTNTYWYTIEDTDAAQTSPSFGIAPGNPLSTTPLFNLSCAAVTSSSSASSATSTSASGSAATSGAVVTGGTGLTPSQGAGNGIGSTNGSTTATGAAASTVTSVATGSNGTVATGTLTSVKSTGSATASPSTATANAAAAGFSGSLIGAVGVLVAVAAAL